jgi:hypothetical protein
MRLRFCIVFFFPLLAAIALVPAAAEEEKTTDITWKRTVVDTKFRSEGVAIADVNKDGKMDVVTGEWWFEAPDWKPHAIRKGAVEDYTKGENNVYCNSFCCWIEDFNHDGWPDVLVIGFPGKPCHWYENPKGKDEVWKEHLVADNACNETPQYVDLFGTGKRVLLMGLQPKGKGDANEGQMVWLRPGKDPTEQWEVHAISESSNVAAKKIIPGTFKFSHGLGIGDINGDKRADVICTAGWWEQPAKGADATDPWTFHPADLGPDCSDMYAFDLNGDGKADVLSSSAHQRGIWWHEQNPSNTEVNPTFVKHDLFANLVSQTHALHFVDINGDGLKDLVTGKRWWAHGPKGDVDPSSPAMLYWLEAKRGKDGVTTFTPHEIDKDSGVGTQFTVADINGDGFPDVIVSNKKGTYIFEQVRAKK